MSQNIEEVILEIQDQWMNINGVVGIGPSIINSEDVILVFVSKITPEITKNIPSVYKEFPVKIIKSGIIYSEKTQ